MRSILKKTWIVMVFMTVLILAFISTYNAMDRWKMNHFILENNQIIKRLDNPMKSHTAIAFISNGGATTAGTTH